jgi:hypothetical protein
MYWAADIRKINSGLAVARELASLAPRVARCVRSPWVPIRCTAAPLAHAKRPLSLLIMRLVKNGQRPPTTASAASKMAMEDYFPRHLERLQSAVDSTGHPHAIGRVWH